MAPVGSITISWRNGEDEFCIAQFKSVCLLQEKCGCGIYEIAARLNSVLLAAVQSRLGGNARVEDVRETIRIGLMGGGKSPEEANRIIATCVDGQPLAHSVLVAYKVIEAYLIGVPDDPLGKPAAAEAATGPTSSTTKAASAVPPSTD